MDYLQLITDYFEAADKRCYVCGCLYPRESFAVQGCDLISNAVVVDVTCAHCGQRLGTALVSVKTPLNISTGAPVKETPSRPKTWTKKDEQRLKDLPAINYDDVVDAHEFFSKLGPDWSKHLPKVK